MDPNEYQELAIRTAAPYGDLKLARAVAALGLAGEAGEVADIVKKEVGHGHTEDRVKVMKELGDVLWYVARTAQLYGYGLEEVMVHNIEKLRARYPEGFSTVRSIYREEE